MHSVTMGCSLNGHCRVDKPDLVLLDRRICQMIGSALSVELRPGPSNQEHVL